jgi:hypothetical protein
MPRQATFRNDNLDTGGIVKSTFQYIWEDTQKFVNSNPFQRSRLVSVADSGVAGTEFAVEHGLGVIPLGYVVTSSSKAAMFYDGVTAWDSQFIYLRATDSNIALGVLVFG